MSAAPLVTERVLACLSLRAGEGLPSVCFPNKFPPRTRRSYMKTGANNHGTNTRKNQATTLSP